MRVVNRQHAPQEIMKMGDIYHQIRNKIIAELDFGLVPLDEDFRAYQQAVMKYYYARFYFDRATAFNTQIFEAEPNEVCCFSIIAIAIQVTHPQWALLLKHRVNDKIYNWWTMPVPRTPADFQEINRYYRFQAEFMVARDFRCVHEAPAAVYQSYQ